MADLASYNPVQRLIFNAPSATYGIDTYPENLLLLPPCVQGGQQVPCLFFRCESARFIIVYCHGNSEDLGGCYRFCKALTEHFVAHCLAVEYPGYAFCPGPCSEEGIMANMEAAVRFLTVDLQWSMDSIIFFGRSLGTGPAVAAAARWKPAGLLLVAPFLSIRELFRMRVGAMASIVEERFPNHERIKDVRSPTLIIHGKHDALIPWEHSQALFEALPTTHKRLVLPQDLKHNDPLLSSNPDNFLLPTMSFFPLPDYCFDEVVIPKEFFAFHSIDAGSNGCIDASSKGSSWTDSGTEASSQRGLGSLSSCVQSEFLRQEPASPTEESVRQEPASPAESVAEQHARSAAVGEAFFDDILWFDDLDDSTARTSHPSCLRQQSDDSTKRSDDSVFTVHWY